MRKDNSTATKSDPGLRTQIVLADNDRCSSWLTKFTAIIKFAMLGFIVIAYPGNVAGQDDPEIPTRQQLETQISILQDTVAELEKRIGSDELQGAYIESKIREYKFQTELMESNINMLGAQWFASHVLLLLVVIVVCSGVAFSGLQLWKSITVAGVQSSSELEVSAAKVRITSSVVGIIVLTISLVFLYIYTREVYNFKIFDPYKPRIEQPHAGRSSPADRATARAATP